MDIIRSLGLMMLSTHYGSIEYDSLVPELAKRVLLDLEASRYDHKKICSTKGGDDTVLDALRNLLKHISERIGLSAFADCLDDVEEHETVTSAGIEYIVSCT
jgi:hypothetical protein